MAVNKASSQNSTASQVTKKPLNDLMDAIKEASSQRSSKADFKNLLAEPTKTIAMPLKQEPVAGVKPQVKPKEKTESPSSNQDNDGTQLKRTIPAKEGDALKITESNKPLVEFDGDECTAQAPSLNEEKFLSPEITAQQITTQQIAGQIPISSLIPTDATNEIKLASMAESDIQNWMAEGRVRIEIQEASSNNPVVQLSDMAKRSETIPQLVATSLKTTQDNKPSESTSFNDLATDIIPEGYTSKSTDLPQNQPTPQAQIPQPVALPFAQPILTQDQLPSTFKSQQTITDLKSASTASSALKTVKPGTLTILDKLNALNQIKDQLKQTLQKGETNLKIQLKPHEMGKVDIKLDISREGVVTAAFKAENRETLETLTRHMLDFQNIFKDAGLQADSQGMNFSMNRNDNPESGNFKGQVLSDDPFMDEVKATSSSGLLAPSTINILT